MSMELVPANISVPAHLANRINSPSKIGEALAGGIGGESLPRISIKGSRFRIVEDGNETILNQLTVDVIIVGANPRLSKLYYAKQWTPDAEPESPDCFSLDGIRPDASSKAPQNDLCASCPQNAWGSRITPQGQQIKACADQKRLAVVAEGDPGGTVYLLQVTPAALKGLNAYQKDLARRGIPPEIVKTRIGFDTDASFPKLTFQFAGFLSAEQQAIVDTRFNSDEVLEVTGEKAVVSVPQVASAPVPTVAVAPAPVVAAAPTPSAHVAPVAPVAPAPAAPAAASKFGGAPAAPAPAAPAPAAPAPAAPAPAAPATATGTIDLSDLEAKVAALIGGAEPE